MTDATKEIANLVDGVQNGVNESIKSTEDGAKEVAEGSELAGQADEALSLILAAVESMGKQVAEISARSRAGPFGRRSPFRQFGGHNTMAVN